MTESLMINIAVLVLFLPLFGFVVTVLLGSKIRWMYYIENTIMFFCLAGSIVLVFFKLTNYGNLTISSEFVWINLGQHTTYG